MRRRITTVLGLVAAASALTACSSGSTDAGPEPAAVASGKASVTAPTPTSTDSAGAPGPAFLSGSDRQTIRNKGEWDLVLRDVRVGTHDGFDRVVVEFKGTGTPGWGVRYVRTPRADGSGEPVDVDGDNVLAVNVSGVIIRKGYPKTPADFFHGARHFTPRDGAIVEDVNLGGVFEGYSQLFLGIEGDRAPYRVFALTHPSRLVVDVKNS